MKIRIYILAFICCSFGFAQDYLWPTNASHLMTSSFCEYRPAHFHAGIDIKTWAREGYDVYAIASGYIQRIRVSPYGYGKAVYLKLRNGYTVIYAHLSRFEERLETLVRQRQRMEAKYAVDFDPDPQAFPVQGGDLIGYSGQTGIGVPHLHFEVRDTEGRPFNPLDLGYKIRDTRAPVITKIGVTPLEYGSHVNGDYVPGIFNPIKVAESDDQPVFVWGRIALSVAVYDQADGASNRFSPQSLRLFVDDCPVFEKNFQPFDYSETRLIDLDRDFQLKKRGEGEFHALYVHPCNTLSFYTPHFPETAVLECGYPPYQSNVVPMEETGVKILAEGLHEIRIEAEDYWGNTSKAFLFLETLPLSEFVHSRSGNTPYARNTNRTDTLKTTWHHDFVRFAFHSARSLERPPQLLVWMNGQLQTRLPLHRNQAGEYVAVHPLTQAFQGTMVSQVRTDAWNPPVWQDTVQVFYVDQKGGVLRSGDRRFRCTIPAGALYEPAWFHIEIRQDVRFQHPLYSVYPNDLLLKHPFKVQIAIPRYPSAMRGAGLYSIGSGPEYISSDLNRRYGILTGKTRSIESVTVLQDTAPPVLYSIFPDSGMTLTRDDFFVQFSFADSLSGISGEACYRIRIDQKDRIVAYDPENNKGTVDNPDPLQTGFHWMDVMLRDHAGNTMHRYYPFYILQ